MDWGKMMSELKLTDRAWKSFFIGGKQGLFEIKATKSGIDKNKLKTSDIGTTPYITRTDLDNGINLFVPDEQMPKYKKDGGNVITIGLDTQTVFYQKNAFWTGQNIQVLKNQNLNYWVAMFIIPLLKIQMKKFSWGSTGATLGRLNRTRIMLPENANGQPDWQFMEDFIKQKEEKQKSNLLEYYSSKALDLMLLSGSLKDVKWGCFEVQELFTFESKPSKGLNHLEKCTSGGTNYVGATNRNNGVLDYVTDNPKLTYRGNAIAFIRNGEGAMGYSIYKAEDFIATQDVSVGYNENLNKYNGLFITTVADQIRGKYNFGYKRNQHRLNKEKLSLPVNSEGQPDWQFMENFMKQIEQDKISVVLNYYKKSFNNNNLCGGGVETHLLPKNTWSTFAIQDICDIYSGVRLTKQEMINGNLPFIGASDSNNGITAFIANTNASLDRNILGVNYNGSVVENFYHPYECLFSDDVKRLKIKSERAGKYAYLFLKTVILKQKSKYQYGYKFNAERMKKQKILLPVNTDNQPDWENIERYMQQIELEKIVCYLKSKHYS
ncbi:restriction endonuclease subunit S [Glaesserella parasuis]|uniref:restriction endonuclease subunit S n=2 Tax=Glaesserella parasuis TaxID=738 RepID=UPI001330D28F|nr:restriction endonuclease subunit S [Glaesserella parasuis]MDO9940766.1 restriction endonuclease subunit S [Glaesserella parasuis]MDP0010914.1 restriction endonuclease subunit S [Glaesserella parasuis]MDP0236767.1 restriction endonuclease subunit S [Glaesserella parasuis]MDP0274335.1 restriction endonuclease subunit S [Glaesserella parasuis]